jgi:imidazolonepropionase-like amidohydrolase
MRAAALGLVLIGSCVPARTLEVPASPAPVVIAGHNASLKIVDGKIAAADLPLGEAGWITPAFIDSHVHLAYLPVAAKEAPGGIAAVVDLASPEDFLRTSLAPLLSRRSGPMITAPGGYPTQSWGANGFGIEVASADDARAAVRRIHGEGAVIVKIPFEQPRLSPEALAAAIAEAHLLGLKVAAHALDEAGAADAAAAGVDLLAHTPVEELSEKTLEAWRGRAVISTLAAFGAEASAVENLRALRAHGAIVLYGTDLGNSAMPGIDADEIRALTRAGLDGAAIITAATSEPARYWGFDTLGDLTVGKAASFVITERDPHADPLALAHPAAVWIDGKKL